MARNTIVRKLQDALSDAVDSECKVVYILAETRKLLETYPPDPLPFALKLYCHWALHIDLDCRCTTLPFLEKVEAFAAKVLAGKVTIVAGLKMFRDITEPKMFREFIFFDTFKEQFRQLLQAYNLPTAVCDEDSRWHEFLTHYAGVIEDGSLSCKANASSLKLVSEVIFTKGMQPVASHLWLRIPFGLEWTIVLRDGRKLNTELIAPIDSEKIWHSTVLL
jgi:hypothetical protein